MVADRYLTPARLVSDRHRPAVGVPTPTERPRSIEPGVGVHEGGPVGALYRFDLLQVGPKHGPTLPGVDQRPVSI